MTEPLHLTFDVAVSQRHAFETWTTQLDTWWPPSHTHQRSRRRGRRAGARLGGAIGERPPDDSR